ncbi:peroxisomal biogenesis factor 11c [Megachile rotundata]|uniref:peroxisomal biogenesis factor 11c n=1 Tax=Megachile rotundata TaxID=143995 RepID=UPI000258E857|nr:PREDICTED: peroxisomal membrane protein 11C [Megachile rotundata]XP_012142073.1 PREDICTED: peroxisomal membrane protein 11C [Megachile rotundata]XP_012142074.1 PREDICTED: peroxisomal membrane protein 11C [Megachile rotundata]
MNFALVSEYLETYEGRDKFLRTLSYMAKLATLGASSKEMENKLKIFGSQMSECRVILRLLDDIPMIHYAMSYGWGKEEPDWLIRWAELIQIAVNIIFCPIEHITWAGTKKLVKINIEAWDNTSTWFWIISLHLSLLKSLQKLKKFNNYKTHLCETTYDTRIALKAISKQWRNELLTTTRLVLDISYAVSYLPPGVLWGGRLKAWQVGALGTLSSLIGLYQALNKRSANKRYS